MTWHRIWVAAVAGGLGLALANCGGDDGRASVDEVAELLEQQDEGYSKEQARCVAELFVDSDASDEGLRTALEDPSAAQDALEVSDEDLEALQDASEKAAEACLS